MILRNLMISAGLITAAGFAYAQTDAGSEPKRKTNRLMEEVVVTAQKREEDSQDVPIAISAFSGEKLDAFGIENTGDLQKITPGLTFTYTYGYTVIYLRGVGSDAFLPSADPSVATYIDGINIPATQGKNDSLGPVQRVEVLKGPQGTLFGRNATGGAISIVTANPPAAGEGVIGSIKGDFGNYGRRGYQFYAGSNIVGGLGATVALFEDRGNIIGDNILSDTNGEPIPGPQREDFVEGGRLKLVWDLNDTMTGTLIGSYINQFNGNSLRQENTRRSPLAGGDGTETEPDREVENNFEGGNGTMNFLYGAIFEWSPGPIDVKFTASNQVNDVDWGQYDLDSTQEDQTTFFVYDQPSSQDSYELQFTSNENTWLGDKLEWAAGIYHLKASTGFERLFFTVNTGLLTANVTNSLPPALGDPITAVIQQLTEDNDIMLESTGILDTDSTSVYFQGTWTFNEAFNVTLGARRQEEHREIGNTYLDLVDTTTGNPPREYYDSDDYSRNTRLQNFEGNEIDATTTSWRAAFQWFATDWLQVYASASRSFKSPTFNVVNFFSAPDLVKAEKATAYELGFKSDMLDGALRLNGAIFSSVTEDLVTAIVSFTSGGIVRFSNAGQARSEGAEIDFNWQPMPNWNPGLALSGSASYIDAEYTDYKDGAGFDDDTGLYFGPDNLTGLPLQDSRDFTGNAVVRTPKFSSSASLNQFLDFGDYGAFEFAVDYAYKDEYNTTPQASPFFIQDQYELWNARATWFYDPWGLQVAAYVDNIKDKEYFNGILQQDFGRSVTLAPPKFYGLRLKWDFGMAFE